MAVRISIKSGPEEGRTYDFSDDEERIVIGRNPDRCHVCLPPEMTAVGREHLALRRQLGRYRLILNATNPVLIDGRPALDGMELPMWGEVRLGRDGPLLLVETLLPEGVPETMWRGGALPKTPHSIIEAAAQQAASNRRLVIGTFIAIVLSAVGVTWALLHGQDQARGERDLLRSSIGELEQASEAAQADLDTARDLLAGQLAGLKGAVDTMRPDVMGLQKKIAGLDARVEDLKPRLQEHLQKAHASVLLVLARNAEGDETPLATAWVAADELLATNAHVAKAFHTLAPGNQLIARTAGENPKDFVITGVSMHPGYRAFQELWDTHAPTRVGLGGGLKRLNQVPSCDVATMTLEDATGLGPPLTLAGTDVLTALGPGDVVGFLGYPLEDMAGGAVNLKAPSPTTQVGHLTGVTNFFLGRTRPELALLVQHSMTTVGGTSGSPVIDSRGRVIAIHNAGNFIFVGGKRVPGADVNFAQRVDLLRELMEDRADAVQAKRTQGWKTGIAQFHTLRSAAKRVALSYLSARLSRIKADLKTEPTLLLEETGMLETKPNGIHLFTKPYSLPGEGWFVFFAWSTTAENIDLLLMKPTDDVVLLKETEPNPFPLLPANADKAQDLRIVVGAGSGAHVKHGEFVLRVYHFVPPKPKPAELPTK